ncbi:Hypothetical predicted protein, partial [Lynx pardinus]
MDAQADRAFLHLNPKLGRMQRHLDEDTSFINQNIPALWDLLNQPPPNKHPNADLL